MNGERDAAQFDLILAKEELRKQSEWLRITLSSIGDAVIATDAEGRVNFMNGVAETLTGWSQAEAAGRPLLEVFNIVNEHTRRPAENPALPALREGAVVGLANHTALIARDGAERLIDDSAAPVRASDGSMVGAVLVFRDVTERRRADEARSRLASIVESSADAIISKSLDGTILSWNAEAQRVFGYSPEEAIGQPITMLIPSELLDEERSILERLRRGERIEHFETVRVTKAGRRIDISLAVSPVRNGEGEVVGASKVARDITERKRAEAERARLAETLQLALTSADLGTWDWDPETDLITLSERAAEIYGVPPGQNFTREWMRGLLSSEYRDRVRRAAAQAVAGHADYDMEYPLDRSRGGRVWVAARGRGVYDGGKLTRMIGVVQDVTARKEAEEALRESEARHRVLAELGDATQPLTDPVDIMATSARLLAEHLGVDRCAYAEVEDESVFVITGDHPRGVPSIVGRWPVAAFGTECARLMLANEPYVVIDVDADLRIAPADRPAYQATNIAAVICIPLHKDGRFTAAMAVHQKVPRNWTPAEVRLVTTVVGRCWEALERAAAERALAASRARLDYAVRASGIGFWYCDLPFDLLQWDDRVKAHFGLPPEGVVTIDTFYDRLHPDDRDRTRRAIERSIGDRTPYDIQYRTVDPTSGAVKWVRALGGAAYGPAGLPTRFDGVTIDVTEQRRAEEEAKESAERFLLVSRATNDAVWDWDVRTNRVWWNEGVTTLFGYRPDQVGPDVNWWVEHIHPEDRERVVSGIHDVIDHGGLHWSAEYRFGKADGSYAFVADRGYAVHGAGGETIRMLGGMQDVTARMSAEADRRRSHAEAEAERAKLAEVFRLAPSFMAVLRGPEHIFERSNEHYTNLVGGRKLIGLTVREALPEIAGQGLFEILDRVYRTGEAYTGTDARVVLETEAGLRERILDFVYQPMRDVEGTVSGILVQGIDQTNRRRAEADLIRVTAASDRRKRLYETILSSTPDFIYVFSLDHRVLYANDALLVMWGHSPESAIGKTFLEIGYEPWHAQMHDREIDQVRATKQPIRGEVPFTGTNGRRIYDYIFVPVLGADGEVEAVAGTTRDVTDRQAMEQELREADRKKDDFIALLAHELRNPLAPIRNGLQVLRMAGRDVDAAARARGIMERQLTHMVRLIDDLLDVSRISRNKMELRRARVSLADVIASAVETARPLIDEAGHELTISLPAAPVHLDADLTRLAQVFSNLLTNSAKYTPPPGRIGIAAERAGGEVVVSVRDTGIGIPASSLPNIFDMFSQVDRSIERSAGGLGIGLALVKGLVEMHGGTVAAASPGDGAGSTFTVTLPVTADRTEAPSLASDGGSSRSQRRILVVDDNRDGASSLAEMLRLLGNEVRTAHDGIEAVEQAERFRPEVILMDVGMPRLNGLDATRLIREQPWGKAVIVVALTGWGQEGDRKRSREAGCDGHLVKPVGLAELERFLAEARPRGE